jgi:hypothetical protein
VELDLETGPGGQRLGLLSRYRAQFKLSTWAARPYVVLAAERD